MYIIGSIALSFGEGWVGLVLKGLYPATDKNTATESLWAGDGINFICFALRKTKPVVAVFCAVGGG